MLLAIEIFMSGVWASGLCLYYVGVHDITLFYMEKVKAQ